MEVAPYRVVVAGTGRMTAVLAYCAGFLPRLRLPLAFSAAGSMPV